MSFTKNTAKLVGVASITTVFGGYASALIYGGIDENKRLQMEDNIPGFKAIQKAAKRVMIMWKRNEQPDNNNAAEEGQHSLWQKGSSDDAKIYQKHPIVGSIIDVSERKQKLQEALTALELDLRREYQRKLDEIEQSGNVEMARLHSVINQHVNTIKKNEEHFLVQIEDKLLQQREELDRKNHNVVANLIEEERNGRLSRQNELYSRLNALEKNANSMEDRQNKLDLIINLDSALRLTYERLNGASSLSENDCKDMMKSMGSIQDDFVTFVTSSMTKTLNAYGNSNGQGFSSVLSLRELQDSFDTMEPLLRQYSKGNGEAPFSYSSLFGLPRLTIFGQSNKLESSIDDAASSLSRGNVGLACEKINQLHGWPRLIARSWLLSCRKHLEMNQQLSILLGYTDVLKSAFVRDFNGIIPLEEK